MSAIPEKVPETSPEASLNGHELQNRAGNRRGMSAGSQANLRRGNEPGPAPEERDDSADGAEQQLLDMRHAYSRPAREDRTPAQRACRRWMRADIGGFMRCLTRLEAKLQPARDSEHGIPEAELDEEWPDRLKLNAPVVGNSATVLLGICEPEDGFDVMEVDLPADEAIRMQQECRAVGLSLVQGYMEGLGMLTWEEEQERLRTMQAAGRPK
jgi:hypothetical protein